MKVFGDPKKIDIANYVPMCFVDTQMFNWYPHGWKWWSSNLNAEELATNLGPHQLLSSSVFWESHLHLMVHHHVQLMKPEDGTFSCLIGAKPTNSLLPRQLQARRKRSRATSARWIGDVNRRDSMCHSYFWNSMMVSHEFPLEIIHGNEPFLFAFPWCNCEKCRSPAPSNPNPLRNARQFEASTLYTVHFHGSECERIQVVSL